MLFPLLGAHISGSEFHYSDLSWKDFCGQMANLVGDSGCNKGRLSNLVEAICLDFRQHDEGELRKPGGPPGSDNSGFPSEWSGPWKKKFRYRPLSSPIVRPQAENVVSLHSQTSYRILVPAFRWRCATIVDGGSTISPDNIRASPQVLKGLVTI